MNELFKNVLERDKYSCILCLNKDDVDMYELEPEEESIDNFVCLCGYHSMIAKANPAHWNEIFKKYVEHKKGEVKWQKEE